MMGPPALASSCSRNTDALRRTSRSAARAGSGWSRSSDAHLVPTRTRGRVFSHVTVPPSASALAKVANAVKAPTPQGRRVRGYPRCYRLSGRGRGGLPRLLQLQHCNGPARALRAGEELQALLVGGRLTERAPVGPCRTPG